MSFTLKSIELNNMRAHSHFLFEPAKEGITAISGVNGAGKSSIVDLLAWCIYGTRPSGVRNRDLIKEGVDPKKKPVSTKAIVYIGGIEYVIERKIITPQGSSECNVWGRKDNKDPKSEYTHVAGPAVTHVEKFLKNELGMNEKGFLTSVLIQQKQVDQIVSATPRERGAVIEELTGIASITNAINKTNEETRGLEKASAMFRVGNLEESEARVDNQEIVCQDIEQREYEAIKEFNIAKDEYLKMSENLKKEELKVNQRIKLTNEVNAIKSQVEFLNKQAEDDLVYIASFKNKDEDELEKDSSTLKREVESKRSFLYNSQYRLNELAKESERTEKALKECNNSKGEFTSSAQAELALKEITDSIATLNKKLEELTNEKSMYVLEIKHSKESHKHIDGEDKNCPICKSELNDPELLKKEIMDDIVLYENKLENAVSEIASVHSEISSKKREHESTLVSIQTFKNEIELNSKKELSSAELVSLNTEVELIKNSISSLEAEYDRALRVEADKRSLEAAKKRSSTVNETISANELSIDKKEREIIEIESLTDEDYRELLSEVNSLKSELDKISLAGKELVGRKRLENERLQDYKANLEEVEAAQERYDELSNQIEISASASTKLSKFKADRIRDVIPTLEFYASDFLSKFTGGSFTKLSMDEKFNTFVTTEHGKVRPVAQLSGGELSSASIALRLGIAMLLNSSDKNVLILDEVLVSMDEDRARQIMETIGSMTNSQVIFIAHNSDINSVADKTVLVTK